MNIRVDVFPIAFNLKDHPLAAYRLTTPDPDAAGGVFAARVRTICQLPSTWLRGQNCLVTTAQFTLPMAENLLRHLHEMAIPELENTVSITAIYDYRPTAQVIAQYTAEGILEFAHEAVVNALRSENKKFGNVEIMRNFDFKGVVIGGKFPAVQIIVRSVMNSTQSFEDYLGTHNPEILKANALEIKCRKTSGTFQGMVGTLNDIANAGLTYREKLKGYMPTDYPVAWLDSLPGNHPVVALKPNYGKKIYHYPAKALRLVISMANLHQFAQTRDVQTISGHLKIAPGERHKLVYLIFKAVHEYLTQKQSPVKIGKAYNQQDHPNLFASAVQLGFKPELRFANGAATIINKDSEMMPALKQNGIFRLVTPTIQVAVVSAIVGEQHRQQRRQQLIRFKNEFSHVGITLQKAHDLLEINDAEPAKQRADLRTKLKHAIETQPDIVLVYLPETDREKYATDDPLSLYNVVKTVLIGEGIASQIIYEKTLGNEYADANIVMGMLGKTGNIPYVLANPLSFTDIVVGLDIGRRKMANGSSVSMGAMSRIYLNDGNLIGYSIAGGRLVDGETIPPEVLENILPPEEFGGKRVVIHRDGRFPNAELESLMQWGETIQAVFYPIEVTKSGTPRIYQENQGTISQAPKQTIFYLDEQTAFIVTMPPPGSKSTAQPIRVRNLSTLTLNEALLSVTNLTLLHYGSVRAPRLPVSTHASDKIAGFYLRDIRPAQTKGDKPFWL